MPDKLKLAAQKLARIHRKYATEKVMYRREGSAITVPASRARIVTEVDNGHGLYISVEQWTWIIDVNDLILDGEAITPQSGDQIIQSTDGEGPLYEVSALPGQSAWNWADAYQTRYKIFSKLIGTNP